MNNELRIEHYLSQLDRALWAMPVGQRSEIITEIKSHIRDAMERAPEKPVDAILADIGNPQDVANKYLSQTGMQIAPARGVGPWFKYLAYGFLGFCALMIVGTFLTIWYFSPLIKIDGTKGKVSLLGGTINIDEDLGNFKVGSIQIKDFNDDEIDSSGTQTVTGAKQIVVPFNTAKLSVEKSSNNMLMWNCKSNSRSKPAATVAAGTMTLNLEVLNFAKCNLRVPSGVALMLKGVNGKVDIDEPQSHTTVDLVNGKVDIQPDPTQVYNYDVSVKNGMADDFVNSNDPKALKIKVSVVNGLVHNEQ